MRYFKVDKKKFKAVLKAHKIDSCTLSIKCGYSKNWVSDTIYKYGGIGQPAVTYLELVGVKYEEYKYIEPPKESKDSPLTVAEFKALVCEAVREALIDIEIERKYGK